MNQYSAVAITQWFNQLRREARDLHNGNEYLEVELKRIDAWEQAAWEVWRERRREMPELVA